MITQIPTENFIDEMEIETVTNTACITTVTEETRFESYVKNLDDTSLSQLEIQKAMKSLDLEVATKLLQPQKQNYLKAHRSQFGRAKCFIKARIGKSYLF